MGRFLATFVMAGLVTAVSHADDFVLTTANTDIKFECSKPGKTHVGGFKAFTGTANYDGKDFTTLKFDVDIDVNSIFTDTEALTSHLKTADFFDSKAIPKAKFTSTKVEKDGGNYKITGKLNMHGKTKDVTFPAKLDVKDGSLTMSSQFKINRFDWAINYGKGKMDDDVKLAISVNAKKK